MLWNEPYLCENRCKLRSRESLQITKAKWWHNSCSLFPHYIRPHTMETVIWLLLFAACFSDSCVLRLGRPRGSLGSFRPSEVGRPHWHNHIIADGHTCNCNMRTRIRYNASTNMIHKQTGMDPIERLRFRASLPHAGARRLRKRNLSIGSLPTALWYNTINSSNSQNTQDIPINNSTNHRGIVHFCHFPLSHSVSSPPQYSHKKRRPRDGKRRHLEVQLLEAPAISQRVKLDITGASSNWTNNVEKCFLCQHCAHEQLCCFARTRVNSK